MTKRASDVEEEIQITQAMISAGECALDEGRETSPDYFLVQNIYTAMVLASRRENAR